MAGMIVTTGGTLMCTHGGQVTVTASSGRVKIDGQPVAKATDQFVVAGCPFTVPPGVPQPCVKIRWVKPASKVLVEGTPVVLQSSQGVCVAGNQAVQGTPQVVRTQVRVKGT